MSTFGYYDRELDYFDHPYNDTRLNERAVEIPIALEFIARQRAEAVNRVGLEVGNVLGHYRKFTPWDVVDRHEVADGVANVDVFDITDRYDWVVAISTVEHVRWDEEPKDPAGAGFAIQHLWSLLRPGGRMLVTVPFGWHPYLDAEILGGLFTEGAPGAPLMQCSMVRCGPPDEGLWRQTWPTHERYAKTTRWAESVWIAEWQR